MKLTEEDINNVIKDINYINPPNTTTTICLLTLENGFVVVGKSACVDPAEFDSAIGQSIARSNAIDKVWELEGYLLAQRIYEESK